jgi:uncharacterized protein YqgQ
MIDDYRAGFSCLGVVIFVGKREYEIELLNQLALLLQSG